MRRIFSKIRKTLISPSSSPTGKYLFYAFGEILLVMIGILLALQVNNWNERRKDREVELRYLNSLDAELGSISAAVYKQMQFDSFQKSNAQLLLNAIDGQLDAPDPEKIIVAMDHVGWNQLRNFMPNDVWKELHSTGNIGMIQNTSLRDLLTALYGAIEQYYGFIDEWNSYNLGARRIISSVLPISLRRQLRPGLDAYGFTGKLLNPPSLRNELNIFKSDMHLKGFLYDIEQTREASSFFLNQIMNRTKECRSYISQELKR